jgi:hypothetical protein
MRTIDLHPEYINLSDEELIKQIPSNTIVPLTESISAYYDSKLLMSQVFTNYGYELGSDDTQQQVQCLLPSHGSQDRHPSAKYYPEDRNTGASKPHVYCHKCQKSRTPFWLMYNRESFYSGIHLREFFVLLKKRFNIPFPRHLFLEFDPMEYYVFEASELSGKLQKIRYAETLLQLKEVKDPLYLSELKRFWQEI